MAKVRVREGEILLHFHVYRAPHVFTMLVTNPHVKLLLLPTVWVLSRLAVSVCPRRKWQRLIIVQQLCSFHNDSNYHISRAVADPWHSLRSSQPVC